MKLCLSYNALILSSITGCVFAPHIWHVCFSWQTAWISYRQSVWGVEDLRAGLQTSVFLVCGYIQVWEILETLDKGDIREAEVCVFLCIFLVIRNIIYSCVWNWTFHKLQMLLQMCNSIWLTYRLLLYVSRVEYGYLRCVGTRWSYCIALFLSGKVLWD